MRTVHYFCILALATATHLFSKSSDVIVNTTNGRDYYHLELTLAKEDFTMTWPKEWFDPQWPESTSGECKFTDESGGFIIFIKKSAVPVPSPNCKSDWLRVTMNGRSDSEEDVQTKRELWDRLLAVKAGKIAETPVVLELNPYVTVLNEKPLILELDYCNLYFRTAWGAYIGNTVPVHMRP